MVDAIEFQYGPRNRRDLALSKALDIAHGRGIGLIAMKPFTNDEDETSRVEPAAFRSVLDAIWSDERIASCSLAMRNTDEIREATAVARSFSKRSEHHPSER